jgi:DNA ligase (NAD+)
VTIGKTGRATPVGELEPVALSGSMVTFASLCNQDEINRLGVNIGDEVYVEKSAEIIPKVMGVHRKHTRGTWHMPEKCPSCDHALSKPEGMVDFYCWNPNCSEQAFARLKHATNKGSLDIDGCGEVTVRELMKHHFRRLSDIFDPEKKFDFLKPAARKKLLEGREVAKSAPLWRKLNALCIEGVGQSTCKTLASEFGSLEAMLEERNLPRLQQILKDVKFTSLMAYLTHNDEELNRLETFGVKFEDPDAAKGPLTGKAFVITGNMLSGTRDQVSARIEQAGGVVKSGVTKLVHYVVSGAGGGDVKANAARKLGTPVITEDELYKLMGQPMPTPRSSVDPDKEY